VPLSFRSLLKGDKLTLVAPEWGHSIDPRKADALGFTGEIDDGAPTKIQWVEGNPDAPVIKSKEPVALQRCRSSRAGELVPPLERADLKIRSGEGSRRHGPADSSG
jgi:hypothetical protein